MPPRYWFYQLQNLGLRNLNRATAIPGLNREDAYLESVAVSSINEQKRIADKLDSVLARVDACRDRLDRVPAILKRFRQSVLAAATTGKLTEDWREQNLVIAPWSNTILGAIAHIQGGVTKDSKKQDISDEEIPYLRVANVQRGFLNLDEN